MWKHSKAVFPNLVSCPIHTPGKAFAIVFAPCLLLQIFRGSRHLRVKHERQLLYHTRHGYTPVLASATVHNDIYSSVKPSKCNDSGQHVSAPVDAEHSKHDVHTLRGDFGGGDLEGAFTLGLIGGGLEGVGGALEGAHVERALTLWASQLPGGVGGGHVERLLCPQQAVSLVLQASKMRASELRPLVSVKVAVK